MSQPNGTEFPTESSPPAPGETDTTVPVALYVEDLVVRNYDRSRSYALALHVRTADSVAHEETYRLAPGECVSEWDVVPDGTYDVEVELLRHDRDRCRCRVGPGLDRTVVVEVGNGVASVSEGLD